MSTKENKDLKEMKRADGFVLRKHSMREVECCLVRYPCLKTELKFPTVSGFSALCFFHLRAQWVHDQISGNQAIWAILVALAQISGSD